MPIFGETKIVYKRYDFDYLKLYPVPTRFSIYHRYHLPFFYDASFASELFSGRNIPNKRY